SAGPRWRGRQGPQLTRLRPGDAVGRSPVPASGDPEDGLAYGVLATVDDGPVVAGSVEVEAVDAVSPGHVRHRGAPPADVHVPGVVDQDARPPRRVEVRQTG